MYESGNNVYWKISHWSRGTVIIGEYNDNQECKNVDFVALKPSPAPILHFSLILLIFSSVTLTNREFELTVPHEYCICEGQLERHLWGQLQSFSVQQSE